MAKLSRPDISTDGDKTINMYNLAIKESLDAGDAVKLVEFRVDKA